MRTFTLTVFYILFSITLTAQVPVSKEPRHHVVFENERFRILNVLLPPGDTTQYHVHATPSVFISLTKTHTASQNIGKQPVEGVSVAGNVWFENLSPPNIKIHRVWNMDTSTFHVIDVELLGKDSGFSTPPLVMEHMHLSLDTPWVRSYTIRLGKNEQLGIKEQQSVFVLVAIGEASVKLFQNSAESKSITKAGSFYIIKANDKFSVTNLNNTLANFVLLEIK